MPEQPTDHSVMSNEGTAANAPSFQLHSTPFSDLALIQRTNYSDARGIFGKLYSSKLFDDMGVNIDEFKETIFSISAKDVIRGMHYQEEPYASSKLVSVVKGSILDVVVCIKPNRVSQEFGKIYSCYMSANNCRSLLIPPGYAHGFRSLDEETIVVYNQSAEYSPDHDKGINYLSFEFDWNILDPIVSEKDRSLPPLAELHDLTV
jgi:dTDP-4-dehydrorhamnose 3,5-epimerase